MKTKNQYLFYDFYGVLLFLKIMSGVENFAINETRTQNALLYIYAVNNEEKCENSQKLHHTYKY